MATHGLREDGTSTLSVIDTSLKAVTRIVTVGPRPIGVAVHPAGNLLYVANSGENTVSIIDTTTYAVLATAPVGAFPFGLSVHPSGHRVYVANTGAATVSVLDATTGQLIATVSVGTGPQAFGQFIAPVPESCVGAGRATLRGAVKTAAARMGIGDVTMTLSSPTSCSSTTSTDVHGRYRFSRLAKGSYTLTPSKEGCLFDPPSRTITVTRLFAVARFRGICP